jgi:hypothetical protein
MGGIGLVLLLVAKLDTFGRNAAVAFATVGLSVGGYKLWRALQIDRDATIPTADDLPVGERPQSLRRLRRIFAVAIAILSAWTAYDLWQLEYGTADHVSTFGPAALVYTWLGFWPAVSLLPALGALVVWSITRRIRKEMTVSNR